MIMKIAYAFLWQENFIKLTPLYNPIANGFGAMLMPYLNELSAKISGVPQTDEAVNKAVNVYPG